MIPNAYCKEHDEIEPQNWDYQIDGLWICPCCSKKNDFLTKRLPNGKKPLDAAIEAIFGKKECK